MITVTSNIKTVDFFLFSRCEKPLNFAFLSCFLVKRQTIFSKLRDRKFLVLTFCISLSNSCTVLSADLDTLRRGRAHLHQFQRLIYKRLMNFWWLIHQLPLLEWTQRKAHRSCLLVFFPTNLYHFRKMEKAFNLYIYVDICLLVLEVYIQVSTYQFPCYDKNESFFALPLGLKQHFCYYTTAKSLWTLSFRFCQVSCK